MINSKNILLYKIILVSLLITLGITYTRIKIYKPKPMKNIVTGEIINIKEYEDYTQIELKNILITYKGKIDYKIGDIIKVEGKVEEPNNNTFPNLFNYKKYLKSKKIDYIIKASNITLIIKNNKLKCLIKNKIIQHIENYKTSSYLKTFILGDNTIDDNIKETYQTNGVSHLFAVSGMHLSLFASILFFILKRLNEKIKYLIIIIFFIFFAFLTNYSPSILRALILYILLTINKTFELDIKTIYLLIIDLISLLLYNPFYIYNTGFIFSFTISGSLILFSNIINKSKTKILTISLISFVTSIPILINSYHEINILTPINNIIFVPLVSLIVFPMSLLTIIMKPLDNIFKLTITILEQLSIILGKLNIKIILCHIPLYIIIIYYIVIMVFIIGIKNKKIKYLIPLILLITIHTNIRIKNQIVFLDVKQGDSTLLNLNKTTLIDTGGIRNSNTSIVKDKTIPYLKSLGIKKLDTLILTHGDFDHAGEAINLINNFKVERIIFNCGEYSDLEKEIIKALDKKKIKYYSCIQKLDNLYFLQTKEYDNENDNSNVIYTKIEGYKFMFMGDAGIDKEKDILNKYNITNVDVLKVGHHGSKTSSSESFINEMNSKYSIISVGNNNRYGHPNKEVLNNLDESKIYRTDEDGSIMFKIKNNKLNIKTCLQ